MPTWLWIAGIFIALTIVAVVVRTRKQKPLEPVDLEFDMRALKQIKHESEQAKKIAKTRELANRQYSSSKTRMDDDDPPGPGFFDG